MFEAYFKRSSSPVSGSLGLRKLAQFCCLPPIFYQILLLPSLKSSLFVFHLKCIKKRKRKGKKNWSGLVLFIFPYRSWLVRSFLGLKTQSAFSVLFWTWYYELGEKSYSRKTSVVCYDTDRLSTVKPPCNEGQNWFVCYIEFSSDIKVLFYIFFYYWGKENRSL